MVNPLGVMNWFFCAALGKKQKTQLKKLYGDYMVSKIQLYTVTLHFHHLNQ